MRSYSSVRFYKFSFQIIYHLRSYSMCYFRKAIFPFCSLP